MDGRTFNVHPLTQNQKTSYTPGYSPIAGTNEMALPKHTAKMTGTCLHEHPKRMQEYVQLGIRMLEGPPIPGTITTPVTFVELYTWAQVITVCTSTTDARNYPLASSLRCKNEHTAVWKVLLFTYVTDMQGSRSVTSITLSRLSIPSLYRYPNMFYTHVMPFFTVVRFFC